MCSSYGQKLVSIVIPCYNSEEYIARCLDSILDQTYRPIELLVVDDGSKDATGDIVRSYKERCHQENIQLDYTYQDNQGLAGAVNTGLAQFEGQYLTWLDSDDSLYPRSVERRVHFLKHHSEFVLVRTEGIISYEKTPFCPHRYISRKKENRFKRDIFEDLLFKRTFLAAGSYMVRRSAFLSVFPDRRIQPNRVGQNYQLLLPLTYRFDCGYIDDPLFAIVKRPDSLSLSIKHGALEAKVQRIEDVMDILRTVLGEIGDDVLNKYEPKVQSLYARRRLALAYRYQDAALAEDNISLITDQDSSSLKLRVWYWGARSGTLRTVFSVCAEMADFITEWWEEPKQPVLRRVFHKLRNFGSYASTN